MQITTKRKNNNRLSLLDMQTSREQGIKVVYIYY